MSPVQHPRSAKAARHVYSYIFHPVYSSAPRILRQSYASFFLHNFFHFQRAFLPVAKNELPLSISEIVEMLKCLSCWNKKSGWAGLEGEPSGDYILDPCQLSHPRPETSWMGKADLLISSPPRAACPFQWVHMRSVSLGIQSFDLQELACNPLVSCVMEMSEALC